MEDILEILFSLLGGILEIFGEALIGDFTWPDSKAGRICLCIVIVLLGIVIWRELS
jgi:hypothetical protein